MPPTIDPANQRSRRSSKCRVYCSALFTLTPLGVCNRCVYARDRRDCWLTEVLLCVFAVWYVSQIIPPVCFASVFSTTIKFGRSFYLHRNKLCVCQIKKTEKREDWNDFTFYKTVKVWIPELCRVDVCRLPAQKPQRAESSTNASRFISLPKSTFFFLGDCKQAAVTCSDFLFQLHAER